MMELVLVLGAIGLLCFIGVLTAVAKFYKKVDQGQALIVNKTNSAGPSVTFTGALVVPIIHRAEVMDISVKTIEIDRRGTDGLICKDNIRADIKVTFFVRVNNVTEDVLKVAQSIGCRRASDQNTLEDLFVAKFSEALKTVGKQMEFEQLYTERDNFKDGVLQVLGTELNGYILDDAAIDYLEQTPITALDSENILDSQGIRKITRMTAEQNIRTNELRQNERKAITKQNLEADEAILELERRKADAEAKQSREIATVKAREAAETSSVQAGEFQRAELARIKAEEEIAKSQLNKERQVEVAEKDKQRVIAIKTEQVERDRSLEAISREREVELLRIAKEKALELERKEIAEVVRARIAVDKNVAEEEERIKDLRVTAEAQRAKNVKIIAAEAEAEELLVKDLKKAEAAEKASVFKAKERLTLATAALEAADKEASAKIRMSEGVQAEEAASGLSQVKVKEANAIAIEKEGLAKARVEMETMQARAVGEEKLGMSRAKVKDAHVAVTEREGMVEANVTREKLLAEAAGAEQKGLAEVRVREADASAIEKKMLAEATGRTAQAIAEERQGAAVAKSVELKCLAEAAGEAAHAMALEKKLLAEAAGVRERLSAEASGLAEKAEAMKQMAGRAWEHEEFRIRLEHERTIAMENIGAKKIVAETQAKVLAAAFSKADLKIVGGDGAFFERFVKAASMGMSIDGFVDNSDTTQKLMSGYLSGDRQLADDVKDAISGLGGSSGAVRDLSIAALLKKLMDDEGSREQVLALLEQHKGGEDNE